jgi:hypothetical protein
MAKNASGLTFLSYKKAFKYVIAQKQNGALRMSEKNEDELKNFEYEIDQQFSRLKQVNKISELRKVMYEYDQRAKEINVITDALMGLGFKNHRETSLITLVMFLWRYEANYHFCVISIVSFLRQMTKI